MPIFTNEKWLKVGGLAWLGSARANSDFEGRQGEKRWGPRLVVSATIEAALFAILSECLFITF